MRALHKPSAPDSKEVYERILLTQPGDVAILVGTVVHRGECFLGDYFVALLESTYMHMFFPPLGCGQTKAVGEDPLDDIHNTGAGAWHMYASIPEQFVNMNKNACAKLYDKEGQSYPMTLCADDESLPSYDGRYEEEWLWDFKPAYRKEYFGWKT